VDRIRLFLNRQWNLLLGVSGWITTAVAGFWPPPPSLPPDEQERLRYFGRFFLAVVSGLFLVAAYLFRDRRHTPVWVTVGIVFTALVPVAYFSFERVYPAWTCEYPALSGRRVVVGPESALTEEARAYRDKHPHDTCEQLIWDYGGNLERIWTKESIDDRRWWLAVLHATLLPVFGGAMISVIQAIYCTTRPKPRAKAEPKPTTPALPPAPGGDARPEPKAKAKPGRRPRKPIKPKPDAGGPPAGGA
jgi:hypothetical protein